MEPKLKKEKRIKNKPALFLGLMGGLISIIFLREIFQTFIALICGCENITLLFEGLEFFVSFEPGGDLGILLYIILFTAPTIYLIGMIELSSFLLSKTQLGFARYAAILFQLCHVGFLIVNLFYGAINVILNFNQSSDWNRLVFYLGITGAGRIAFMFMVMLILVAYLNYSTKKIIKYINI